MDRYLIERRGGFAGLKASGTVDSDALAPQDREALEDLFKRKKPLPKDPGADRYTYMVTRQSESGNSTREVPESMMPRSIARIVKDRI